jgi:hypothetical protein
LYRKLISDYATQHPELATATYDPMPPMPLREPTTRRRDAADRHQSVVEEGWSGFSNGWAAAATIAVVAILAFIWRAT